MPNKCLASVILTPVNHPLGVATQTKSCTIRVERELVDQTTGRIQQTALGQPIRNRINAACEFDSDSDTQWTVELAVRVDITPREQFRRQLAAVLETPSDTVPDGYQQNVLLFDSPNRDRPEPAGCILPTDHAAQGGELFRDLKTTYGVGGVRLFDALLTVAIECRPALPDEFTRNPLHAQEQFLDTVLANQDQLADYITADTFPIE